MKRAIVIIIALASLSQILWAQYDVSYHSCTGCTGSAPTYNLTPTSFELTGDGYIDVVSDFGRRTGNSISNWHRGVDITINDVPATEDKGYHVLSITHGRIGRILGDDGYKLISIIGTDEFGNSTDQNFGYGHIFEDEGLPSKLGDMFLDKYVLVSGEIAENVIIYHPAGETPRALARITDATISYTDEQGTVWNLTTTNLVAQGDPIAPLGTSGNVASHIHLYRFVDPTINNITNIQHINNCKDPLQLLDHYDTQFSLSITTQMDSNGANGSECRARVSMNTTNAYGSAGDQWYSGGLMNIDQVEMLIKKVSSTSPFEVIQGSHFDLRITENSRIENTPAGYGFYPDANTITTNEGSWSQTGIAPFAYGNEIEISNTPYDDFYFLNFRTRIHKNDNYGGSSAQYAYITEDARYPDGNYFLLASATTIKGQFADSDPTPLVIDNFRPYIKEVLITQGGLPRYHAVWEWDAEFNNGPGNPPGRLEYNRITITSVLTSGEDLAVQITASEPMDEIFFTILGPTDIHTAIDYSENTSWFEISSSFLESLIVNDYYTLNIFGQDLTLNYLTGFPSSPPPSIPADYTAAQLPHRTGATSSSWSIPFSNTTDQVHFFYLTNCLPGEGESGPCILDANIGLYISCDNGLFNPVSNQLCIGTTLDIYDFSCAACAETAEWNFDGGTAELVDADPDYYRVFWNTPGTYTVSLSLWGSEAFNENGTDTYSQTIVVSDIIPAGCSGGGFIVSPIVGNCSSGYNIIINILDGTPPYTIDLPWTTLQTSTSGNIIEAPLILFGQTIDIIISDANFCQKLLQHTRTLPDFSVTVSHIECYSEEGIPMIEFKLNFFCGTRPLLIYVNGNLEVTFTSPSILFHYMSVPTIGNTANITVVDAAFNEVSLTANCYITSIECYNNAPVFNNPVSNQFAGICDGEQICINYNVADVNGDGLEQVVCSFSGAVHTPTASGYLPYSPGVPDTYYSTGTFCFTPTPDQTGILPLTLSVTDIDSEYCSLSTYQYHYFSILCCPTGFDYPQELQAIYDCNGDLYQPAEATVTALTNGCNLDFTLNGSTNHTLTHLGEGVYDLTVSFNNQTYQFENAITVAGIHLEDNNLQITHTAQPSLGACSSDQCNGQISLSVAGGSGYYTYFWSDDICYPDTDQMMLPCNSPFRNYLCTGSYTVTVVDDMTGCETVYTASVGLYYPTNAGVLSDNEFSVSPTIFSGSTTLTYRVGYDAQVSISMFNGQGILVDSPIQQEFRAEGQYNMTHSPPSGLPQGVYYYVLYVCEQYITRVAIKIG